ncbi:MAG: lytic transglycosylase domain-containing protein [Paracoccaceae bacterium]
MKKIILMLICSVALGVAGVEAKDPPPFKDFSAKRIKPPKSGSTNRITIQIEPKPEPAPDLKRTSRTEPDASKPKPPTGARYDWFWEAISPAMIDSGPGRLDPALRALAVAEVPVPAPRLADMQKVAKARGVDILRATVGTRVSPALALAVMWAESNGRADVVSGAGAQGLMQLMPATAERFGVQDAFEPGQNIRGGVKYLDWLMREFDGDPMMVIAGYNAGEGAVKKHQGVPPYNETRDYVPKVLAAFRIARGLCLTPPELLTDGCVFAAMN